MTDGEHRLNTACDALLEQCAGMMQEIGAEPERIIDRVMTYGMGNIVAWHGSVEAAKILRRLADNVAGGALASLDFTAVHKLQ